MTETLAIGYRRLGWSRCWAIKNSRSYWPESESCSCRSCSKSECDFLWKTLGSRTTRFQCWEACCRAAAGNSSCPPSETPGSWSWLRGKKEKGKPSGSFFWYFTTWLWSWKDPTGHRSRRCHPPVVMVLHMVRVAGHTTEVVLEQSLLSHTWQRRVAAENQQSFDFKEFFSHHFCLQLSNMCFCVLILAMKRD